MTQADIDQLMNLRAELFAAIRDALEEDGHCKTYEGAFAIHLPNYFEQEVAETWCVTLDCYKIGPSYHYEWRARTLGDAIAKAARDVRAWIAEYYAEAADA